MLASALRRNIGNCAFEHFQQSLLYALTADIACDRRIFTFACDFINFIDIDNAVLCALDIEIGRLNQAKQNIFHVLADIACLRQRRRIGNRERNLQRLCQCLRKQRLARAGRSDQQNVALLQLYIVIPVAENAFIVIVNRNTQRNFCPVLPDDVLVECFLQFARSGQLIQSRRILFRCLGRRKITVGKPELLVQNALTNVDAFIADVDVRTGNQLVHRRLRLPAKRAANLAFFIVSCHNTPLFSDNSPAAGGSEKGETPEGPFCSHSGEQVIKLICEP